MPVIFLCRVLSLLLFSGPDSNYISSSSIKTILGHVSGMKESVELQTFTGCDESLIFFMVFIFIVMHLLPQLNMPSG